jgi:hypothetical protein
MRLHWMQPCPNCALQAAGQGTHPVIGNFADSNPFPFFLFSLSLQTFKRYTILST